MKINWKVRIRNKVWLAAVIAFFVSSTYTLLGLFDIAPAITQNAVLKVVNTFLELLELTGIILDPTTPNVADSDRAMHYSAPGVTEEETN